MTAHPLRQHYGATETNRYQMTRWRDLFGHDEPYDSQADGIETAIATAREGGFTVIEGACGTGKTMLALAAGIALVRDPDTEYRRVLALTSVKQQLRGFENDLRRINDGLSEDWQPISGLTLVGKADVCPYARENAAGIDETTVYDRCENLRERTRDLSGSDGQATAGGLAERARSQQIGLADTGNRTDHYLETAGELTPYPPELPEYEGTEYCPFYAAYLEDAPEEGDPIEAVPFDFSTHGLIEPEELVALSVGYGTCPHSMMGALLPHVEVVLGNYYHAFDPTTVAAFTGALLDEETFLICDEAHMLEPRVRDLVSDGIADTSLRDASMEFSRVLQALSFEERRDASGSKVPQIATDPDDGRGNQNQDVQPVAAKVETMRSKLRESDVSLEEVETTRQFVRDLREELDRRVRTFLDREQPNWRAEPASLSDEEIPLRPPETPQEDSISQWAAEAGYDGGAWVRAEAVGAVVERTLNAVDDEEIDRAAPAVGRVLGQWYRADHERHFRAIELSRTWNDAEPSDSWRRAYTARLALHNCLPGEQIAERIGSFGGGILMSATLEPIDVFREVTGLDALESAGRPVAERTYGLAFPEENRASFAVAAPKFTYANRGAPGEETPVRQAYADAICTVASQPGNVLVCMPSYAEAEWAAEVVGDRVEKQVLLDERSGDGATETLKRTFFDGDSKVLVTSLRGTLTEGVDYRGDRLSAAVVCGVPIVNTERPLTRAVRAAYDRVYGNGFEYALTVPAVRKARQAVGRVIRGPDERGVRVLVDERYARESWDDVRAHFPAAEREEFQTVSPDMLEFALSRFSADDS